MIALLGTLALAAVAPTASAAPIAIAFEGTFSRLSGSPASIPFHGTLFYDTDTPNTSPTPPTVLYRFAPGAAGIQIHTAEARYASDPSSADVAAWSTVIYVDENGEILPPDDPDAIPASYLFWTSPWNGDPGDGQVIRLANLGLPLPVEPPLPDSSDALAALLATAWVSIYAGPDQNLSGAIANAVPVPEPSSAALLCFGVALLAARARGSLRPCKASPSGRPRRRSR